MDLDALVKIDLRDVLPHETCDFTLWRFAPLEVLGEARAMDRVPGKQAPHTNENAVVSDV
jgi:hypothetical protein